MKNLRLPWKIIIFSIILLFTIPGGYYIWKIYQQHFGTYQGDLYYSDTCYGIRYQSGRERLYNPINGKYLTSKLDWIASPAKKDTLLVCSYKGKRGYLNRFTGQFIVPPKFQRAWKFSEGIGAVVKNHKLGFINKDGKEVIPCRYFYNPDREKRIDFLFKEGYCTVADSLNRHGLINKKGEWVVSPQYDYINNPNDGYRIVCRNLKYGLLNKTLEWVLPIEFDNIIILRRGFLVQKDGGQQLLGFDGKTVLLPFVYDDLKTLQYNWSTQEEELTLSSGYTAYEINGLWGVMDWQGKIITKAIYDDIKALYKNRFSCLSGNHWITLNEHGEIVS
jgi:hypothetical protein